MAKVYKNGKSLCQKHFRNKVDINKIMRKYNFNLSGLLSSPAYVRPEKLRYVDFTSLDDYQTNCNKVAGLKSEFDKLPIDVKIYFKNNPGDYIEFMYNVSNPDEEKNTAAKAVELGLVNPDDTPARVRDRLIAKGVEEAEIEKAVQEEMEKKYPTKPVA